MFGTGRYITIGEVNVSDNSPFEKKLLGKMLFIKKRNGWGDNAQTTIWIEVEENEEDKARRERAEREREQEEAEARGEQERQEIQRQKQEKQQKVLG